MIFKISGSITLMLALLVLGAWIFRTTVRTERTFNASVADVWRVWNDADSIKTGITGLLPVCRQHTSHRLVTILTDLL